MHIKTIKISALRGVNHFVAADAGKFGRDASYEEMPTIKAESVNVFCGRNGGGKSTILDVVRTLADPGIVHSLKRDRLGDEALYSFIIEFATAQTLHCEYEFQSRQVVFRYLSPSPKEHILKDAYAKVVPGQFGPDCLAAMQQVINATGMKVGYWSGPADAVCDSHFIAALRDLAAELPGIEQEQGKPLIHAGAANEVRMTFASEPTEIHNVPFAYLPSGWKAAAGLLAWARKQPVGSVLVIEEPETHMHARLQRVVAAHLLALCGPNVLQLFVASHSAVFQNPDSWGAPASPAGPHIAVFLVDGNTIELALHSNKSHAAVHGSALRLLDHLGQRASDLLQANSIIWVEGPSDKIYIKLWLERWCAANERPAFRENVHYVFSYYGGSILSHYHAVEPTQTENADMQDMIAMLRVNRHAFVVMDRDFDFTWNVAQLVRTKPGRCAKYSVIDALPEEAWWVTEAYTVESYLPASYVSDGYLVEEGGATKIGTKLSKVELAIKYRTDMQGKVFADLFEPSRIPESSVARLYERIREANA